MARHEGKTIDSLSYFAESIAVAGPFLLGIAVVIGAGVWFVKARRRRHR